jgi:hypothetical protein
MIGAPTGNRTRRAGHTGLTLVALVALAGVAACGGSDKAAEVEIPFVFDLAHDPTSAIPEVDPQRENVMEADLFRNRLEKEFTWHGVTLAQVMRAAYAGDSSLDAWVQELTSSTDDITAAVGLVYGPTEARAFNQQWAQHTQFLVDYAVAISGGDQAAAALAREQLVTYAKDSGTFFQTVTGTRLPADAVRELLDTHIAHMLGMIDAVDSNDTAGALAVALEDNAYLSQIALGISSAIVGQDTRAFPGALETDASMYCTIVTKETGDYLLRELFVPSDAVRSAASFEAATGVALDAVVGVIDQLQATDPVLVAQSADLALDRAFDHARPITP